MLVGFGEGVDRFFGFLVNAEEIVLNKEKRFFFSFAEVDDKEASDC